MLLLLLRGAPQHMSHLLHARSHGLLVMNVSRRTCGCGHVQNGSLPEDLGAGPKWAMSRSGMQAISTDVYPDYVALWQACRMISR